jgi:hypothetical protein
MQSQKIKLFEFYSLDVELNGRVNQQTGVRTSSGLLDEKISLVAKYWLTQLSTTVKTEVAQLDAQRDELIKKYGTADENGGVSLQQSVTELDASGVEIKKINPKFLEFNEEFGKLLNVEKDVQYEPIKLADLAGVESTANFPTLFKFIAA